MEKIFDASNNALNHEEVATQLKAIFIDDDENYKKFSPLSDSRVKKPAQKMRKMLEDMGADFISFPTLEQTEYKFQLVLEYGEDFTACWFTVDYWSGEVYAG